MTFFEWLGRVIMLVLAGMITLSIIGAIAAIPSGSLPERMVMAEQQPPPLQEQPAPAPSPEPRPSPGEQEMRPQAPAGEQVTTAPAEPEKPDPAEWLEAITYALLALVGIAALATLILWRMLRRIADALERITVHRA